MIPTNESPESPSGWALRVSDYLDKLQDCVEKLDEALDDMRMGTKRLAITEVDQSQLRLAAALEELEQLIAAREVLIRAEDAPSMGITIRDILAKQTDAYSKALLQRCQKTSKEIDNSRERAVALFVCQFHLADLSESLLTLLRGAPGPRATYGNASDTRRPADMGGSILNRSA